MKPLVAALKGRLPGLRPFSPGPTAAFAPMNGNRGVDHRSWYPASHDLRGLVSLSMERLCERPGCSDTASVAYGMRPEDLVFWLDRLDASSRDGGGVLCRRHADSMIVPRSWTLDDLRDPDLHLFRPPKAEPSERRTRRSAGTATGDAADAEQLALGVDAVPASVTSDESATGDIVEPVDPIEVAESWSPSFDDGDDLDGLLAARSPLLARAFRGDDRPRS